MSLTDVSGFTELRTRPKQPAQVAKREVRRCSRCNAVLSRYTKGDICGPCESKEHEAALTQELAKADAAKRQKGWTVSGGVKLVPTDHLPGRMGAKSNIWPEVVREFLQSGVEIARVENHGLKAPASVYAKLREAIGSDRTCYATVRRGDCYLVRTRK